MRELEIRTTGEVLLHEVEVGKIIFAKPFCEADVAGIYRPEGYYDDSWGDETPEEIIDDLENNVAEKEDALRVAQDALKMAQRIVLAVLPKFAWGAANLCADDIELLNTAPSQIENALAEVRAAL